jgi:hypothetical protein
LAGVLQPSNMLAIPDSDPAFLLFLFVLLHYHPVDNTRR